MDTIVDDGMKVLAISGSLRADSSNTKLLEAAAALAPAGMTIELYEGVAALPHFNPDLDRWLDDPLLPAEARALRARVGAADAILVCSPEYAHGVPGSLKNALDWLVGGGELPGKPVALLNAAPAATHAQAMLAETLRTMAAVLVEGSPFAVPLVGKGLDAIAMAGDPDVAAAIAQALSSVTHAVAAAKRDALRPS